MGGRAAAGGGGGRGRKDDGWSYPLLDNGQIVDELTERGINVMGAAELKKGRPGPIMEALEALLINCMDLDAEELHQPKEEGLELVVDHANAVPVVHFKRGMDKLLAAANCSPPQFSLSDYHKPDMKRVRNYFSSIINFVKFREQRLEPFDQATDQLNGLARELQAAMADQEELEAQLAEERARQEDEQPEIDSLRGQCTEAEEEIAQLNTQQARLRAQADEQRKAIRELEERIETSKYQQADANQQVEAVGGQVVADPESVRRASEAVARALEEGRTALQAAEERRRATEMKKDVYALAQQEVRRTIELLQAAAAEKGKLSGAESELRAAEAELDGLRMEREEAKEAKEHAERAQDREERKLQDFRPSADVKSEAAERARDTARGELEQLMEEEQQHRRLTEERKARQRQLEAQRTAQRTAHTAQLGEMDAAADRLQGELQRYHRRLFANLGAAEQSVHTAAEKLQTARQEPTGAAAEAPAATGTGTENQFSPFGAF